METTVPRTKSMETNGIIKPSSRWEKPLRKQWSVFGVKYAPLMVPWERRLQTVAVSLWIVLYLFLWPVTVAVMYWLMYSSYWWVPALYMTWIVYDLETCNRGGRAGIVVNWARRWTMWKLYAGFFPVKLIKTADLDPKKNYLLGSHPHGLLCSGAVAAFGTEGCDFADVFPGIEAHLLTLEGHFWVPGIRELMYSCGACAATKRSIEYLMGRPSGVAAILVVGGAREALFYSTEKNKITLYIRKGFIKIALRYGISLVPTFSFGEDKIYGHVDNRV